MDRPTKPIPRGPESKGVHAVRVRYCDSDPMGVAHHGAYIAWLEEARTELLRTSGISYAQLDSPRGAAGGGEARVGLPASGPVRRPA